MRRNRNGYMLIAMVLLSCLLGGCGQPPQEAASEPAEETRREAMSEMIQETTIQETIREAAIQETAVRETLQETREEKTEILYSYEVRELDYVDEENLFLMGSSQGGAVSALAGAAQPEAVRGMILLYPAFILADRANELFSSVEEIPDTYYFMWMDVGRAYFEPLIGYDIYEDIAAYDRDVLLIHGDADSIVPLSYSERALEVYPSARLEVISGAGHGFGGEDFALALDYILEYLQANRV